MTVSNEQIQATLTAHENRFVVDKAAIAHQDALTAEIRQNLAQASQILAQTVIGQAENRQQIALNQEQIAVLAASITELRNTVADIVRSQGGTPSS
jgi:hypothetical protein